MAAYAFRQPSILPGFGLTFGFTVFFLSSIVLLPLAALAFKTANLHWDQFYAILTDPRAEPRAACLADLPGPLFKTR